MYSIKELAPRANPLSSLVEKPRETPKASSLETPASPKTPRGVHTRSSPIKKTLSLPSLFRTDVAPRVPLQDLHVLLDLAREELGDKKIGEVIDLPRLIDKSSQGKLHVHLSSMHNERIVAVAKQLADENRINEIQAAHTRTSVPVALNTVFKRYKGKIGLLQDHLAKIEITPVFTAHPSELRPPKVLEARAKLLETLTAHEAKTEGAYRHAVVEDLKLVHTANYGETTQLLQPTVSEEVSTLLGHFDRAIFDGVSEHLEHIDRASREELGSQAPAIPKHLSFHTWIGGDRDGNPNVTAHETLSAARRMKRTIIDQYRNRLAIIGVTLRRDGAAYQLRDTLDGVVRRLRNTAEDRHDFDLEPYPHARALSHDLSELTNQAQSSNDPVLAAELTKVDRLVSVFGFHLASLEWRQHSHQMLNLTNALAAMRDGFTTGSHGERLSLVQLGSTERDRRVDEILTNPVLLNAKGVRIEDLSKDNQELLASLKALVTIQKDSGLDAVKEVIMANTDEAAPILALQHMVKELGLKKVQVTPLFETIDSLRSAPQIVEKLLQDPSFSAHLHNLGRRFEIMVGYSDSAKDGGRMAADIEIASAQSNIAAVCKKYEIEPLFFHGRGGTVGRGKADPAQALAPFDPLIPAGKLKQTEQGEVVANRFGHRILTAHYLDECFAQALNSIDKAEAAKQHSSVAQANPDQPKFKALNARLSQKGYEVFQNLLKSNQFAKVYYDLTTTATVRSLRVSSRPSQRAGATSGAKTTEFNLSSLRAVPFTMAAKTAFANFTSWYSTASALRQEIQKQGGAQLIAAAYHSQPKFQQTIDQVRQEYEITDLYGIARNANPSVAAQKAFLNTLSQEFTLLGHTLNTIYAAVHEAAPNTPLIEVRALGTSKAPATAELDRAAERHLLIEMNHVLRNSEQNGKLHDPYALQAVLAATVAHIGESG